MVSNYGLIFFPNNFPRLLDLLFIIYIIFLIIGLIILKVWSLLVHIIAFI
jgi:hypothetical protein